MRSYSDLRFLAQFHDKLEALAVFPSKDLRKKIGYTSVTTSLLPPAEKTDLAPCIDGNANQWARNLALNIYIDL